eukprot:s376_g35.t1
MLVDVCSTLPQFRPSLLPVLSTQFSAQWAIDSCVCGLIFDPPGHTKRRTVPWTLLRVHGCQQAAQSQPVLGNLMGF